MRDNDSRILRKTRDAFENPGMLRDRRGKVSHDAHRKGAGGICSYLQPRSWVPTRRSIH